MAWFVGRAGVEKFLGLMAFALLFAAPAKAYYIIVDGRGTVEAVPGFGGVVPTGSVEIGDKFQFSFAFDPAAAPRVIDGGPTRQVFAPDVIAASASFDAFGLALNEGPQPLGPRLTLGTGFRLLPGDTMSSAVFIQQWQFNGTPFGELPFPPSSNGYAQSASLTVTSFFRQDFGGVAPTYADVRDPRGAALNRFQIALRDGPRTLGFIDGSFEGGYYVNASVPEPGTWALLILGFGAVGGAMRRRRATGSVQIA